MTLLQQHKLSAFGLASGGFFVASMLAAAIPLYFNGVILNRGTTQRLQGFSGSTAANLRVQAQQFDPEYRGFWGTAPVAVPQNPLNQN